METHNNQFMPSRQMHAIAAALAIAALAISNSLLNRLYQASNHPVDYMTGQTSFNADRIKGWYAAMSNAGTLDVYWATQLFDFVFITSVAATGICTATFLARLQQPGSFGQRLAYRASFLLVAGASFDAMENLISFAMLAAPQTFPAWLAIPYSTAASIKFGLIALAALAVAGSIIAWMLNVANRQLCTFMQSRRQSRLQSHPHAA